MLIFTATVSIHDKIFRHNTPPRALDLKPSLEDENKMRKKCRKDIYRRSVTQQLTQQLTLAEPPQGFGAVCGGALFSEATEAHVDIYIIEVSDFYMT